MKRSWIKLYIEILDDPKMGRLPDQLWRRAIELFLIAGEFDCDGLLPPVDDIAWHLRISPEQLIETMQSLSKLEIVHETPEGWVVSHFKDRQFSESYERVKRFRNARSNADCNAGVAENESSSSSPSDSQEGGSVGEETIAFPETPRQAAAHPDIMTYQKVCGRFPGQRDYANVIETIQFLREKHKDKLEDYLKPYWTAWSTRKAKGGQPYNPGSLVWLCEWAMTGQIPSANGREPVIGETKAIGKAYEPFVPKEIPNIVPMPDSARAQIRGLVKKKEVKK